MEETQDLTTVTGCINAGNFAQGLAVASVAMPGNQQIIDALQGCMADQLTLSNGVKAALAIAGGN